MDAKLIAIRIKIGKITAVFRGNLSAFGMLLAAGLAGYAMRLLL